VAPEQAARCGCGAFVIDDPLAVLRARIVTAFQETPSPVPSRLRGSDEGEEPFLLELEFRDVPDWRDLPASFLDRAPDGFGSALSFFSPEAFRYYLPAYLLADLEKQLVQADPAFVLCHAFADGMRDTPVNPGRYGDWTWAEAAGERFVTFTSVERAAIAAYLRYRVERDVLGVDRVMIEQAVRSYWASTLP
jgi:hypothetical protein